MSGGPTFYALVGMRHVGAWAEALVAELPEGEHLELVREPTNRHDANAVQVWARGRHVGYLAAKQVRPLALAMDERQRKFPLAGHLPSRTAGKLHIEHKGGGRRWPLVEVMEVL